MMAMPRLVREPAADPVALCPECGSRLALGAEGTTWSVRAPSDVADRLVLQMAALDREELVVLLLDARCSVTAQATVYVGNVSAALVKVGEVFSEAVRRNAPRIVVGHNHPSGDPTPSPDDLRLTSSLIAAGRLLDIEVLDHIIVGSRGWTSLRATTALFDR